MMLLTIQIHLKSQLVILMIHLKHWCCKMIYNVYIQVERFCIYMIRHGACRVKVPPDVAGNWRNKFMGSATPSDVQA